MAGVLFQTVRVKLRYYKMWFGSVLLVREFGVCVYVWWKTLSRSSLRHVAWYDRKWLTWLCWSLGCGNCRSHCNTGVLKQRRHKLVLNQVNNAKDKSSTLFYFRRFHFRKFDGRHFVCHLTRPPLHYGKFLIVCYESKENWFDKGCFWSKA